LVHVFQQTRFVGRELLGSRLLSGEDDRDEISVRKGPQDRLRSCPRSHRILRRRVEIIDHERKQSASDHIRAVVEHVGCWQR